MIEFHHGGVLCMQMTAGYHQANPLDLLVVGLGPAGAACAMQGRRDGLRVLAVSDEPVGGLVRAARRIDNLPGSPRLSGLRLAQRITDQLNDLGLASKKGRVIELAWNQSSATFSATTQEEIIYSRSLCLATGTQPRPWTLSPENQIHRDARSLPENLKNKEVLVVGGGEAALDTALTAKDRGARVSVVIRRQTANATPLLQKEAHQAGLHLLPQKIVTRVVRKKTTWILGLQTGTCLQGDELVVCVGRTSCDELFKQLSTKKPGPSIIQSDLPGVFLAGDIIRGHDRYVATALGDGQRAAIAAFRYLKNQSI
jgi:thioredoxin reductase (NADPH)